MFSLSAVPRARSRIARPPQKAARHAQASGIPTYSPSAGTCRVAVGTPQWRAGAQKTPRVASAAVHGSMRPPGRGFLRWAPLSRFSGGGLPWPANVARTSRWLAPSCGISTSRSVTARTIGRMSNAATGCGPATRWGRPACSSLWKGSPWPCGCTGDSGYRRQSWRRRGGRNSASTLVRPARSSSSAGRVRNSRPGPPQVSALDGHLVCHVPWQRGATACGTASRGNGREVHGRNDTPAWRPARSRPTARPAPDRRPNRRVATAHATTTGLRTGAVDTGNISPIIELGIEMSSSGTVASETASIGSGAPRRSSGTAPLENAHHAMPPSPPRSTPTIAVGAGRPDRSGVAWTRATMTGVW